MCRLFIFIGGDAVARIPQQRILNILGKLQGDVGLFVEVCDTKERFTVNAQKQFIACSLIKVPLLALLLKEAEEGKIDLNAKARVSEENRVGGTGLLYFLNTDLTFSWKDLATLMIAVSDNSATNAIIDHLGMSAVNDFLREIGLHQTSLQRKMLDRDAIAAGLNNYTTAFDMGQLLIALAQGTLVGAECSKAVLEIMSGQLYTGKLPAALPAVPSYAPKEEKHSPPPGKVAVANKTGELERTQHDMGVFFLPNGNRYVIAMLTSNLESDYEGISAITDVSKEIYEALSSQ